jgi:uncharacterized ferritin-like protein (DUF455 family)
MELRRRALDALMIRDPRAKAQAVHAMWDARDAFAIDADVDIPEPRNVPGRPDRPHLVHPARVPRRALASTEGRAALMHAVAHIEFNAINLALDACWRFAAMPLDYYRDWLRVAAEEAHHFELVRAHLNTLGSDYGDVDAHDGLWQMAQRTAGDVLARMALVPRILEARGLDVTPGMQERLRQAGDARAVEVLGVILRDEVGHVAIGNRWFHHLCTQRGAEPVATMLELMRVHRAPGVRPPLNLEARQRAGFGADELDAMTRFAS